MTTTALHYAATHSSGRVHLRKSNGRVYTHAIVTKNFGGQSFCGRYDLAVKALSSAYDPSAWELVEAKEITKAEFAALTKASKQKFSVVFMGKTHTKTVDGAAAPLTLAVASHYVAHVSRHKINVAAYTEQLARLVSGHTPSYGSAEYQAKRIADLERDIARGYYEQVHTEQVCVNFYTAAQAEYAATAALKGNVTPKFRASQVLEVSPA